MKEAAASAADSLSIEQKQNLQEVADLLLRIYETLVNMRYIDPVALIRGPHELDQQLLAEYEKHSLDPAIIYLYGIMPYIDEVETEARDFFQGGSFFNQMKVDHVDWSRDPRYAGPSGDFDDEDGQYMYPWYTPLSNCGNHSPIIIYDAREHRIWVVDQMDNMSTDPRFCRGWYEDRDSANDEESNWGDSEYSDLDEDDGISGQGEDTEMQGSSEFGNDGEIEREELAGLHADQSEPMDYDEGFEHVEELSEWERREAAAVMNRNSLEPVRSRSAGDVLRDINQWYGELKELPGQGEYTRWMKPEILRALYLRNGWPEQFNGHQFEIDKVRAYCTERALYDAEEPLRTVKRLVSWSEHAARNTEHCRNKLREAHSLEEEWTARFELWKAELSLAKHTKDLGDAKAEAEKLCPGGKCPRDEDLPLWQLEKLRVELQWARERAHKEKDSSGSSKDNPEQLRYIEARHRRAKQQLQIHEEAFEAGKAEAEHMCPGKSFQEVTGIRSLGRQDMLTTIASEKETVESLATHIAAIHAFAASVPRDALDARIEVEIEIGMSKKSLDEARERLKRSEKHFAEHGNTD